MIKSLDYEYQIFEKSINVKIDRAIVKLIKSGKTIAWVASGLSTLPAEFTRRLALNYSSIPGILFSPIDYVNSNIKNLLPVLVTYRGRNLDIQSVAEKIVQMHIKEVIVMTGLSNNSIVKFLEDRDVHAHIVLIPDHREENRFVSALASIGLIGIGIALINSLDNKLTEFISSFEIKKAQKDSIFLAHKIIDQFNLLERDWPMRKWIILGNGLTNPAALGWQSALAEAGISSILVCDVKDYSHGKYNSALREKNIGFILLSNPRNINLTKIIKKRFQRFFPIINIEINNKDLTGEIDNIFAIFHSIAALSESLGFKAFMPPKNKATANWSNWGKIFSRIRIEENE